jgi:hypothetical protein
LLGAGEAEIVFAIFTETPTLMDHAGLRYEACITVSGTKCQHKSDICLRLEDTEESFMPLRGRVGLIATPKAYIQAA